VDDDRRVYLELLQKQARKYDLEVFAYCLVTNHQSPMTAGPTRPRCGKTASGLGVFIIHCSADTMAIRGPENQRCQVILRSHVSGNSWVSAFVAPPASDLRTAESLARESAD
jgi:hypothetical protein